MAYGIQGFLGIGKETTFGTPVSITDYVKILSEGVSVSLDRFEVVNIHGSFAEPSDATGIARVEGSIELSAHPVSVGYFLKSAFPQSSISVVASGALWTTIFRTPTADFATGVAAGQPYTLEIFRDVTSSHRYAGAVVNNLGISFQPNQDVRVSVGIIAKTNDIIAKSTPTFPGSPVKPLTFDTASISLGGSATARLEALNFAIDNQLEGIAVLNGTTQIAKVLRRGPQKITMSGTLDFPDITEYLDFLNQTERSIKVSVTAASSFQLIVDVPRMIYTGFPMGMSGRERLTAGFEARGFYHSGSATGIQISLTTTKSDY
jgi:hypothetical protein